MSRKKSPRFAPHMRSDNEGTPVFQASRTLAADSSLLLLGFDSTQRFDPFAETIQHARQGFGFCPQFLDFSGRLNRPIGSEGACQ